MESTNDPGRPFSLIETNHSGRKTRDEYRRERQADGGRILRDRKRDAKSRISVSL